MSSPRKKISRKRSQKSKKTSKKFVDLYNFVPADNTKDKNIDSKKDANQQSITVEEKIKKIKREETIKQKNQIIASLSRDDLEFYNKTDELFGEQRFKNQIDQSKGESRKSRFLRYLKDNDLICNNMEQGMLLTVEYCGTENKAYIRFYDLNDKTIKFWIDNTGHQPYCLSKDPKDELEKNEKLINSPGFDRIEEIKKFDLIEDKEIKVSKIYAKTPNVVGGTRSDSIKGILGGAWEANIRYHHNYIFDTGLIPGLIYKIKDGKLTQVEPDIHPEIENQFIELYKTEKSEYQEMAKNYLKIFSTPIPDIRRVAFDIEVDSAPGGHIPNAKLARESVISVSFASNDGFKLVYVLWRDNIPIGNIHEQFPSTAKIIFFENEKDLIEETFRILWEYPIVLSFNGDNFDLYYLFHRARNLKIKESLNPIQIQTGGGSMVSTYAYLRNGVHVDLYQIFANRSLKGYAFGNVYDRNSLDEIVGAFLDTQKFKGESEESFSASEIAHLDFHTLAHYNLMDSIITLELTTFGGNSVLNLIIYLLRITKLPLQDMFRHQISFWIRSILFFEHRVRNYLIPRKSELLELKPGGFGKSDIEGKGFQGAYVISPIPGIHFNTVVVDFSSLYPTIIKSRNLSYETISCNHDTCESNILPDTPYYVCTKRVGIFALVVGFLRDIRVKWFKPRSSDRNLTQEERNFAGILQLALKVFVNGSYGVFGSPQFPLYCLPVAESTTAIGRYAIKKTIEKSESMNIEVLYGDSIVGSRCVVVKEKNEVDVIPIEELWDRCNVHTIKNKNKEIKHPKNIKTISSDGKWQYIDEIIRHKTKKKIFRINQKNGETVCTEDHSLILENGNPCIPEKLKNRKIRYLEKIPAEYKSVINHQIDLYHLVKHFTLEYEYKGSLKTAKWHYDENYIWFGWTLRKNQRKIKRFCDIEDLVKLLGIFIADGHSSISRGKFSNKYACGISSGNVDFLKEIKEIFERMDYNHQISIIRVSKGIRKVDNYVYEDMTHRIQVNSTTWTSFFRSLCGYKSGDKRIPKIIYNLDTNWQKLFYKYYIIGDGSKDKGDITTFTSKSLKITSGFCYLLKTWNIDTAIYYNHKRGVYRVRERKSANDKMHPITTSIRILPEKERFVYDLNVENSHIFVDACGMLLLHNTDSIFLAHPSENQINDIIRWSTKELDIDLEHEKTYQFLALSERKKNYVGIYKDTLYVDIKGMTGKKRNTPPFIKKAFKETTEILKKIKNMDDFKKFKNQIIEHTKSYYKRIGKTPEQGGFQLKDYAITIGIKKDIKDYIKNIPQHIKAAKMEQDVLKTKYSQGDTIEIIKTATKEGVKPFKMSKFQDIDSKKYKELLEASFEQLLDALNTSFEEIKGAQKLDAFF